ncbi:hypothetical protein [Mucilaginibacter sp.]|uniref:hypothetical protein n=1 Tax=Mucilaginibacter sp. TaxID=1882438 RepID=UPI003D1197DB
MKTFKLLLILSCFVPFLSIAQNPKSVELDLLKAFKKIDYANSDNSESNDAFAKKLCDYTRKYPFTISQPFNLLKAEHLDVLSSSDGLFRIYSWDTWTGGTMHFFENVFQYKLAAKTFSILDTPKQEGDSRPNYHTIYKFKVGDKTYYLCVYLTIGSSKDAGQGIQIFTIDRGKLNEDTKIIKTKTGLHSQLYYDYDFFSVVDWKVRPTIYFDEKLKTIFIPYVESSGKVTHKYITYKFIGPYFEKVIN